ncbi:MAG: AI-2E family transporter [Blastomonas sp.]
MSGGNPGDYIETRGPAEMDDPVLRGELKKAMVWLGLALFVVLVAILAQPILLIIGGLVVASILDGGSRLLGRILPIARGFRLAITLILGIGFVAWVFYYAGSIIAEQAAQLPAIIERQADRIGDWASSIGLSATANDFKALASQALGSFGQFTAAVTSALGAVASFAMILVLGIFIAAEPRLYERGLAWMLPIRERDYFYGTLEKMGWTMRRLMAGRLLGMVVEGVGTWILLVMGGVPVAALLGLLTGLLAFLPNIGSIISGVLIVSVGFSAGFDTGLYAVGVYLAVQMIDGYLIVPMVAKKTVDLAPALVLGAQIIFGALFGILGLALADPIVAMLKIALERQSTRPVPGSEESEPSTS